MSSSSQFRWDFEAALAEGGGRGGDEHLQKARPYRGMSLISNQVNMTNCYKHCKDFFSIFQCIHFKLLIAYWMMAGYLGDRVLSDEAAFRKGFDILLDLVYKEKILKLSDDDRGMIELGRPSTNAKCRHRGCCLVTNNDKVGTGLLEMLSWEFYQIGKVVLSKDEMLSLNHGASKLQGSAFYKHFEASMIHPIGRPYTYLHGLMLSKYYATFNPMPNSLNLLLQNVNNPSVLLLRGFDELSLLTNSFPLHKLDTLKILEISGSARLTTIPENTIPQLTSLECLNLSDLPIEEFSSSFFKKLSKLRWLILRGCCKLLALNLSFDESSLEVLDLSYCTTLQNLEHSSIYNLCLLNLSYTPLDPLQLISSNEHLSFLYLRGSKLDGLSSIRQPYCIEVLDLSGCSCLKKLDEDVSNNMKFLWKLDLSWTNVKHLPSLANLTHLRVLSLRGLELDSLEPLASLPYPLRLIELDLSCLKISSSQEFKLEFFQSLENLLILNLSQTSVEKLPDISKLVCLQELLLANCQNLNVLPDLQSLTNLETLDLSLQNDSSSDNRQLEIETKGQRGSFSVPKSLRKLALTNRTNVQKLFPITTLANLDLEFLDLCGTDVTGWAIEHEAQQPQEIIPKPVEIHIISFDDESYSQQPNQLSSVYHVEKVFTKCNDLISDIQKNLNSTMPQEKVEMLHNDLRYIQQNIDKIMSSNSWKSSKELLQELMEAATNLSAADFVVDSANFKQLLRIIVKLKLLVPRKQIDDSKALEGSKEKKKPLFKSSHNKENNVFTEIVNGMQEMKPDLLNSYESLSITEKNCLLCFSIFPYDEDRVKNTGVLKSIVIKKKILIYWWVGEGFINSHQEESVDLEPTKYQNPDPDKEMMMSRDIDAIEQFVATKAVKKPKTIEEIGNQILKVLVEKGFIEPVMKKGRESGSCCIHPFVQSFVIKRAMEEGFFDFDQETGKLTPCFTRSQRACLLQPHLSAPSSCKLWANYISSPNMLRSFETVKTLFNVNESMIDIKQEWFSKMKNLNVLHLGIWGSENTNLIEVNDYKFLENLKKIRQLRVLSLRGLPAIMKLPDSICYLRNLIILDLKECNYLEELPVDIGSLKSLTHLDVSNCPLLYELPKGIILLLKLEVLRGFVITSPQVSHDPEQTKRCGFFRCKNNEGCNFKDLLKLKRLRDLSIIVNIGKFPEDKDLKVFREMKNLCKLKILWQRSICNEDLKSATRHESLVRSSRWQNKLTCWKRQQCQNSEEEDDGEESKHLNSIEKLELWCFPYDNAPHWLNPRELKSLKKLHIVGGNLRELHGSYTDENRWNVESLHLKFLFNLDIPWPELKIMFSRLNYLENVQCDKLAFFPCNGEGVWRRAN